MLRPKMAVSGASVAIALSLGSAGASPFSRVNGFPGKATPRPLSNLPRFHCSVGDCHPWNLSPVLMIATMTCFLDESLLTSHLALVVSLETMETGQLRMTRPSSTVRGQRPTRPVG
ncbi:hypothetical protein B0T25DRAFT_195276 [Lasiosphaeria hispida]|uniref:Secreted protein n=1 Tax=Lasiosphaeria hispida TaxID=260671 RepID=A0AAJ0HHM0_9PEZI|nr:hypothetical protein B0T25DRAFT_195276 [Lasiosphaeria hispida]